MYFIEILKYMQECETQGCNSSNYYKLVVTILRNITRNLKRAFRWKKV